MNIKKVILNEFIELMVIANQITNERKNRLSAWGVSFKEIPEGEFMNEIKGNDKGCKSAR